MHMAAKGTSRLRRLAGAFRRLLSAWEVGATVESPLCLTGILLLWFSGENRIATRITYFRRRIPGDVFHELKKTRALGNRIYLRLEKDLTSLPWV